MTREGSALDQYDDFYPAVNSPFCKDISDSLSETVVGHALNRCKYSDRMYEQTFDDGKMTERSKSAPQWFSKTYTET